MCEILVSSIMELTPATSAEIFLLKKEDLASQKLLSSQPTNKYYSTYKVTKIKACRISDTLDATQNWHFWWLITMGHTQTKTRQ